MLTASGAGYSRWRDIAVTRAAREDATLDDWGSFVYLRDTESAAAWSVTAQPTPGRARLRGPVRGGPRAVQQARRLATSMDHVVWQGEDDGEVRRVLLVNSGHPRATSN